MKTIVFDDDPTGSQTVNGCPLLLKWDQKNLISGIKNPSPLLFLLANTRSMPPDLAATRTREMCKSISQAIKSEGFSLEDILFVSRGDSTLRGHGVIEPEMINEVLGPFDATFHAPAFFEGGRTTVNGIHYLDGCPVHTSPFANDQTFGYSTSQLDLWLQEKSRGEIVAESVERLSIDQLNYALESKIGMQKLLDWLSDLYDNKLVTLDGEVPEHFAVFGKAVRILMGKKRFLFRSAASLINGLTNLPRSPYEQSELAALRLKNDSGKYKPGLVLVGSHVPLADQQLEILLKEANCAGIELPVKKIANLAKGGALPQAILSDLESHYLKHLNYFLASNKTPVLYSSRGELKFNSIPERIDFGNTLANLMARLAAKISPQLGYIISKGGVTTHHLLERGLELDSVDLIGQLLPGLSLVSARNSLHFENLPILTFPGNLGQKETLMFAWRLMENIN